MPTTRNITRASVVSGVQAPPLTAERHRWHRLIERRTPDGIVGRLAFGLIGLFVAGPFLFFAGLTQVFGTPSGILVSELVRLAAALAGPPLMVAAAAALWPVYLALTGRIESADRYEPGRPARIASEPDADPIERLKRRYTAGELTEAKFEHRLDVVLDAEAARAAGDGTHRANDADGGRERADVARDPEFE